MDKELEKQAFDLVYKDFLDLSSDFEDSSMNNLPITAAYIPGVRYPERFSLRNQDREPMGVLQPILLK